MRATSAYGSFDPRELHNEVRHKLRKFMSYSQEDSHDLILSLMDACIEEEKDILFTKQEKQRVHSFLRTTIGSIIGFYLVG